MLLHLQDRDALLEAFSSAAQTSVALKIATAELPTSPAAIDSPADLKAPAQNGSAAAHHDSVDSAPGVQSAQEADSSSTSGEEDGAEQPAAHQQQHHAGHAASNIVGRAWSSAINGEEVHSAAAAPLPAPQQQRQQAAVTNRRAPTGRLSSGSPDVLIHAACPGHRRHEARHRGLALPGDQLQGTVPCPLGTPTIIVS